MADQLAWIGLGNMGRGMVKNLLEKGNLSSPLILYNRTQSRATELAKVLLQPTKIATSIPDAVAPASIVFTCLGDDAAVEETLNKALESTDISGKLFVDCSTVHPDTTRRIASLLDSRGASFVACPVFGAPPVAEAGQLVCVLAGPREAVERVKPFCAGVMGRANIDLSETSDDPGRASMLKVLGNSMIFQTVGAVAEGMVVAEKSGLGTDEFHKFLELVLSGPSVGYSNRMRSGDYFQRQEPLFAIDLARKDVQHAKDMAKAADARMKGLDMLDEALAAVKAHAGAKGDIAGVYGVARKNAGLKYENN
ncbi:hypothetical protein VTO42DRAFT_1337 [Malbranchea cinnamomea]